MSGDPIPVDADLAADADVLAPVSIGPRLRSTMAADYAAPYLKEINRLQGLLDAAASQGQAAQRLAGSLAARIATEHRRRLDAETQVEAERERLKRALAAFTFRPLARPRGIERVRRAWHVLTERG